MPEIEVLHTYAPELQALRKTCFPNADDSGEDPFNSNALFLVFRHGGQLIASARLNTNPEGAFITQTKHKGAFRNLPDATDICRVMIHPDFRADNTFSDFITACLLYAKSLGYSYVNGAVNHGRPTLQKLLDLGFKIAGEPVVQYDPFGPELLIQPLVCDLEGINQPGTILCPTPS
ncbi:MAG: hypothetical protein V4543_09355 [Bacteroidota bacterium]